MSEYPSITRGLGSLTPDMWGRIMKMLRQYEEADDSSNEITLDSLHRRISVLENIRPWFFAKLLRARVLDLELENPNVYAYAWVEVRPKTGTPECCSQCVDTRPPRLGNCCDDLESLISCGDGDDPIPALQLQGYYQWEEYPNNSSWGDELLTDGDGNRYFSSDNSALDPLAIPCVFEDACYEPNTEPYTLPATNLLELFNDGVDAGGVDQSFGIGDFMMQAIGGGDTQRDKVLDYPAHSENWICETPPCTQYEFPLKTTPIVLMFGTQESDGTFRNVFQAANAYDGTCAAC